MEAFGYEPSQGVDYLTFETHDPPDAVRPRKPRPEEEGPIEPVEPVEPVEWEEPPGLI